MVSGVRYSVRRSVIVTTRVDAALKETGQIRRVLDLIADRQMVCSGRQSIDIGLEERIVDECPEDMHPFVMDEPSDLNRRSYVLLKKFFVFARDEAAVIERIRIAEVMLS